MQKKTKLNLAELILAVIFFAATASGQNLTEYFIFKISATTPVVAEGRNAEGSPYIRIEMVSQQITKVMRAMKSANGRSQCDFASLNKRGQVVWDGVATDYSLVALNPSEGGNKGLICLNVSIPRNGLPNASCKLVGELSTSWKESQQRFVVNSGHGTLAGANQQQSFDAWETVQSASYAGSNYTLPAWGTWNMTRKATMTNEQIKAVLK